MNGEEYYAEFNPIEIFQIDTEEQEDPGNCGKCHLCLSNYKTETGWPVTMSFMVLCQECGNKRCPKATSHAYECSGSNDPGQEGSRYQ